MKTNRKVKVSVIALIMAGLCGVILFSGCPGAGVENGDETGGITGKAAFSGDGSNARIIVTIERVEGGRAVSLIEREAGRAVTSAGTKTTTDADGNFTFEEVPPGNYTVYASSGDSKEKAIALDVSVAAGRTVTVEGLELTPVGHLSGTITVDNKTTGNLGTLVFIAGTSYMALTDDAGAFTISDVPVKSGYSIVVSRDGASGVWRKADVKKGETTNLGIKNIDPNNPDTIAGLRIIYDGNHYDSGTLPVDTEIYENGDSAQVKEADSFEREGWAFAGWNTKPDGTGTAYFPASWHITDRYNTDDRTPVEGDPLDRDKVTFEDSDITLYAIWAICNFDVLKDAKGDLSATISWHTDAAIGRQYLEIPASINTILVTAIKPWVFKDCRLARDLVIPDTVTSIGDFAFTGMQCLETITLSKNIKEIGYGVFYNTYSVQQVTLGDDVIFSSSNSDNEWATPPEWKTSFIRDYEAGGKKAGTYRQDNGSWTLIE
ncbi:MAG: carboxypeptidase regulatory-like domain-containing protein [Treponema sp.]|nr:carboxypeptidase regulatory-like domain-containing protein [Treponema sp.]